MDVVILLRANCDSQEASTGLNFNILPRNWNGKFLSSLGEIDFFSFVCLFVFYWIFLWGVFIWSSHCVAAKELSVFLNLVFMTANKHLNLIAIKVLLVIGPYKWRVSSDAVFSSAHLMSGLLARGSNRVRKKKWLPFFSPCEKPEPSCATRNDTIASAVNIKWGGGISIFQ